jgi:hypothetical protein
MIVTYPISVRSLGNDFERVRAEASRLAAKHGCQFWWKPEPDDWHHFIFTNHNVAILFVAFLRSDIVGNSVERIKSLFVSPDEVRIFAEHCVYIRSVYEYAHANSRRDKRGLEHSRKPTVLHCLPKLLHFF